MFDSLLGSTSATLLIRFLHLSRRTQCEIMQLSTDGSVCNQNSPGFPYARETSLSILLCSSDPHSGGRPEGRTLYFSRQTACVQYTRDRAICQALDVERFDQDGGASSLRPMSAPWTGGTWRLLTPREEMSWLGPPVLDEGEGHTRERFDRIYGK